MLAPASVRKLRTAGARAIGGSAAYRDSPLAGMLAPTSEPESEVCS